MRNSARPRGPAGQDAGDLAPAMERPLRCRLKVNHEHDPMPREPACP